MITFIPEASVDIAATRSSCRDFAEARTAATSPEGREESTEANLAPLDYVPEGWNYLPETSFSSEPSVKYNWHDESTLKRFARLEAKFLAGKLLESERDVFHAMRGQRHAAIAAETFLPDYLEVQRLRQLRIKLEEIRKLFVPIKL